MKKPNCSEKYYQTLQRRYNQTALAFARKIVPRITAEDAKRLHKTFRESMDKGPTSSATLKYILIEDAMRDKDRSPR